MLCLNWITTKHYPCWYGGGGVRVCVCVGGGSDKLVMSLQCHLYPNSMIHQGIKDQVQYKVTEMQENVVGYGLGH